MSYSNRNAFAVCRVMLYSTGGLVLISLWASESSARIFQLATVDYEISGTTVKFATDQVQGQGSIDRDILADISDPSATASAGRFGEVGLRASIFTGPADGSAFVEAHVEITSDEIVNATASDQRVTSAFVIDGGALSSFTLNIGGAATPFNLNSAIATFDVKLDTQFSGTIFGGRPFAAEVKLTTDSSGMPTLTTVGNDLGATLTDVNDTATVTIPTSFQTADLGILAPGQRMTLTYVADLKLVRGPAFEVEGEYSDPLQLSTHPVFGDITFTPASDSTIPEPSGLVLFGIGVVTVAIALILRSRVTTP